MIYILMILVHTVWDLNGIDPVEFDALIRVMYVLVGRKITN
jgi:uncharacterized membrane protein